jgi:hypothetical protein
MNHLTVFLSIAIFTGVLIFHSHAFAQTTPPPHQTWQPSTNTPRTTAPTQTAPGKTQTTRTGRPINQSKSHQAGKQYGHGQSRGGGVGFGVGATIDLGGIGQRRAEPNPFAVPAGPQPVAARSEQKEKPPPTKKPREATKTDPFANVQLTGEQAKEQNSPQ